IASERLYAVALGARLKTLDLVLERVHGSQHQDRSVVALEPEPLAHVVAVHVRQHQVQDDDVELADLGEIQSTDHERDLADLGEIDSLGACGGNRHAVIFGAQAAVDEVRDARFVFNQKHVHLEASAVSAGSATVTVVPSPTRLAISILPLWASTMALATGRPRPKPSSFMAAAFPPRRKRSKIRSSSSGGMPMPSSETRNIISEPVLRLDN